MTSVAFDAHLHRLTPGRSSGVRLYCFPFAGGSAASYRPWAASAPQDVSLDTFQLPGRMERMGEPAATDLRSQVPDLAAAVLNDLDDRPYGLFGHSMGTLLAYEIALELRRLGAPAPRLLALSGRRAPQIEVEGFQPYHLMPDAEFMARIEQLGGIPPQLLEHRDLLDFMLPTMRADFTAVETYRTRPSAPLDCPLLVFGGTEDHDAPPESLAAWAELSSARTTLHTYPGGHFFLWDHAATMLRLIAEGLRNPA
ncbi:thioesterase II family protein [Streptomyces sp. LN549]|uniref:thioesterase II family protein n=1 Tax=Streptomyces sp. LN549 TaxID=3112979 RepID=UPI003717F544